jgi:hypothetical protein
MQIMHWIWTILIGFVAFYYLLAEKYGKLALFQ